VGRRSEMPLAAPETAREFFKLHVRLLALPGTLQRTTKITGTAIAERDTLPVHV
jgi:hypothetical protein